MDTTERPAGGDRDARREHIEALTNEALDDWGDTLDRLSDADAMAAYEGVSTKYRSALDRLGDA